MRVVERVEDVRAVEHDLGHCTVDLQPHTHATSSCRDPPPLASARHHVASGSSMITSRMSAYTVANARAAHRAAGLGHRFDGGPLALTRTAGRQRRATRERARRAAVRRRDSSAPSAPGGSSNSADAEREQLGERGRDARTGIGIADERVEQRVGMAEVVALLAQSPARRSRAACVVGRSGERLPPQRLGRVVQPVADERRRPVGARRLDEPARPVVGRVAAERQGVDGRRRASPAVGDDSS